DFGCRRESVIALCEAITGERVAPLLPGSSAPTFVRTPLTVIVLTSNPNHHDYPLDVPVLFTGDKVLEASHGHVPSTALRMNGTFGNNVPTDGDAARFATDEEVDAFFAAMRELAGVLVEEVPACTLRGAP